MSDLFIFFLLFAAALGFVSAMIYMNLRSQGIALSRIRRILIELWGSFILIVAIFVYITRILGAASGSSPAAELANRLSRWHELASGQQAIIIVGFLLAVALFIHFIWSLNAVQRQTRRRIPPSDGGI